MKYTTIGNFLDEVASRLPENEALVDIPKWKRFSFREFPTIFAMAKIGVVLISVDIGYQLQQLEHLLQQSEKPYPHIRSKTSKYVQLTGNHGDW